jgi:D-alanyl-lipoteichoic acid acyltransferase DltB (MBOAT superfamily)
MLFNSLGFLFFLPVVFAIYWMIRKQLRMQNILLMLASYFFYACWDFRFLFLLIFSTFLDYISGLLIRQSDSQLKKKTWLAISVVINLGFLGFFKYYNFFAESFASMLNGAGFEANMWTLQIILPVGISFYTFHGLSYVFDIYKNRIEPCRSYVDYSLFVSFFPLLVAGPIERATHLLPQIVRPRTFNYSQMRDGLRQMLWGFFKKVVIADSCAYYADLAFNNTDDYGGGALILGALFFTVQIYCDFSGYSDIALGTARLFGFELLQNFAYPYFSRDIAEFWRRWHISLSSWFRDYLYIPLGGSRGSLGKKIRNTFIIFVVSGFWHGANWTFIAWGALNAIYFLPGLIRGSNRENLGVVADGRLLPSLRDLINILITFSLCVFAWIFFRAESMAHAFKYISGIFNTTNDEPLGNIRMLPFIIAFFLMEWLHRSKRHGLCLDERVPQVMRWLLYLILSICVMFFFGKGNSFIYFQF